MHTSFDNKSSSTSTMLTTQDSLPLGLKKLQWKQQKLSGRHENHSVFAQSNNLKTFLMHKFNELIFFRKKLYFIHFNNTYIEFSKSILISSYIFHDLKLMHTHSKVLMDISKNPLKIFKDYSIKLSFEFIHLE